MPDTAASTPGTPGTHALRAMTAEVLAPKAGNVHGGASFDDADWSSFLLSALAVRPILDRAAELGVGRAVLDAVRATRAVAGSNTNLGMLLLIVPMAATPAGVSLRTGLPSVLHACSATDTALIYRAIREAAPGGLGQSDRGDVAQEPPSLPTVEVMGWAAPRDAVARQWCTGFSDVLERIAPGLERDLSQGVPLDLALVGAHLQQMAREPDSLIRRKLGDEAAREAQRRARDVLDAGWPEARGGVAAFNRLDRWLRGDGRRRNPGASADLVAAGLFATLREGAIAWPLPWSGELPEQAPERCGLEGAQG